MTSSRWALVALTSVALGCGNEARGARYPGYDLQYTPDTAKHAPPDPSRGERLRQALSDVDAQYTTGEVQRLGYPGVAIGLVTLEGGLIWFKAYGVADLQTKAPITPDTGFRLASISKTIAGVAILQLRDEGKLQLDDLLTKYVPEAEGLIYPTRDSGPIRLRNLITHTGGFPHDGPLGDASDENALAAAMRGLKLDYSPGASGAYSNLGAALLGIVVSRVSGIAFPDYVQQRIFAPLGMTSSGYEPGPLGARLARGYFRKDPKSAWETRPLVHMPQAFPGGGAFSTMSDMARYAQFQLSAWPPRDDADNGPLKRASLRESHRSEGYQIAGPEQAGVFWFTYNDCKLGHLVFHNGALTDGYKSTIYLRPMEGVAMVLLANGLDGSDMNAFDRVLQSTFARVAAYEKGPPPPGAEQAVAAFLQTMANPDPLHLSTTFSANFLANVNAPTFLAGLARDGGVCTDVHYLGMKDNKARFEIDCSRKAFEADLVLDNDRRINGLWVNGTRRCEGQ